MSEQHKKLGALLKLERERQGLDLEDVSSSLNIPEDSLQKIESGDQEGLPSPLYFDLFAKSYAQTLGIDFQATMDAIKDELAGAEDLSSQPGDEPTAEIATDRPAPRAQPSASEGDKDQKSLKKFLYIAGAFVGLFIIFMIINQIFWSGDSQDNEHVAEEPATTVVEDDPEPEPQEDTGGAAFDWDVPQYEPPKDLELTLQARSESWGAVVADGDTVVYRNLTIGRLYRATAKHRMRVSVGVPSVVTVTLNGQEVDLRRPSGRIYDVLIDQLNVESIVSGADRAAQIEKANATTSQPNPAAATGGSQP